MFALILVMLPKRAHWLNCGQQYLYRFFGVHHRQRQGQQLKKKMSDEKKKYIDKFFYRLILGHLRFLPFSLRNKLQFYGTHKKHVSKHNENFPQESEGTRDR